MKGTTDMKKRYIEPMVELLAIDMLQQLMDTSIVSADPSQETNEMEAKEGFFGGWDSFDEE